MSAEIVAQSVLRAQKCGSALAKFISPNDTGTTGSHQYGFLLPKPAWEIYTPHPPVKGQNLKHDVEITWHDRRTTQSCITWYGQGTRSEYRLTRFQKGFPYLDQAYIGALLFIVPESDSHYWASVIDNEDEIEELFAVLGLDFPVTASWVVYSHIAKTWISEDQCIEARFGSFINGLTDFPEGRLISQVTNRTLTECVNGFVNTSIDDKLVRLCIEEFGLFRRIEAKLYQSMISSPFPSLEKFIESANTVLNRRKSRAGRSLENHVESLLQFSGLPFKMRPQIDGEPDVVFPSDDAYRNAKYPKEKLAILAVKTTCKDRWRQILNEGKRVPEKYLLTLQHGISNAQLQEMVNAGVRLVVPSSLHSEFPQESRRDLLSLAAFVDEIRTRIS